MQVRGMTFIEDACKLPWWCELCAQSDIPCPSMHPIGEHAPGLSWPPLMVQAPAARRPDDFDIYRCLCGLHLFATEANTSPAVWARHLAHMAAFQASA
jgi:hypothetical protein